MAFQSFSVCVFLFLSWNVEVKQNKIEELKAETARAKVIFFYNPKQRTYFWNEKKNKKKNSDDTIVQHYKFVCLPVPCAQQEFPFILIFKISVNK